MSRKPLIALPARQASTVIDKSGLNLEVDTEYAFSSYTRALANAGAQPVILSTTPNPESWLPILLQCDGLLLMGGEDVEPKRYGEKSIPGQIYSPSVDELDLFCYRHMLSAKKPILGICRGMQVINVAQGGTIALAPPSHNRHDLPRNTISHQLALDPDSQLAAILQTTTVPANSLHSKMIGDLGVNLRVVAAVHDGPEDSTSQGVVIEAVEHRCADQWLIAIQCHPEELVENEDDRSKWKLLFTAFVRACAGKMDSGRSE